MKILVEGKGLLEVDRVWYDKNGLNCKLLEGTHIYFPAALRSVFRDVQQNACTDLTQYKYKVRRDDL